MKSPSPNQSGLSLRLHAYSKRFHARDPLISIPPQPHLVGVIVIPCYDEPHWNQTLDSLFSAAPLKGRAIEILLVVNAGIDTASRILKHQRMTSLQANSYAQNHNRVDLSLHVMTCLDLPARHAGVGWARKIGLDEGLHRLAQARSLDSGYLVCLDADCTCEPDYLHALDNYFATHPLSPGCSIQFSHPLEAAQDEEHAMAVAAYECHLRYYVEALRWAGFPYAYHTIGSAMAVRPEAYMKQGGMNRRKAGEDFYFLNKIMSLGGFGECAETTIYPSPRTSKRVPFGTGQAVLRNVETKTYTTYDWKSFAELRLFFGQVREHLPFMKGQTNLPIETELPQSINHYLDRQDAWHTWQKIASQVSNERNYIKRFFGWFDGFQCMKFLHFMRDEGFADVCLHQALVQLWHHVGTQRPLQSASLLTHLELLRERQSQPWFPSP